MNSEKEWSAGNRAAWRRIAGLAAGELYTAASVAGDAVDVEGKLAACVAELEDARRALRRVCEAYGDNDWDDDLNLGDVIEKHLERHLDEDVDG